MSYRDETLILRERLGDLENKAVTLEGRAMGLEHALLEADERTRAAERALSTLPIKRQARRLSARIVGWTGGCLGAFLLFGGGCILIGLGIDAAVADVNEQFDAHVQSREASIPRDSACSVELYQEDDEHPCEAKVRCRGTWIYRGTGTCSEPGRTTDVDYWDHGRRDEDGTPVIVVSERRAIAVVRSAEETLVLELAP